jgi:hypothetical protein
MITAEKLAEWQRVCDSGKYVGWLATAEQLPLILAVFFEGRFHDAAPDTDGRDNSILGWNQHVVDIFLVGQRVPAVKPNQIVQCTSVSKPDFSVLEKRAA